MVHLFIANEQCHAIFLAAVTDHGFARLLEQYACVPAAKRKIILVDPGFISYEIANLQYQSVGWPSVFRQRHVEAVSRVKGKYLERRRKSDNVILNKMAARELILRVTDGINHMDSRTMMAGIIKTNIFAALNIETYKGRRLGIHR